jgi:cytoskeletal protein RodZ
MELKEKIGQRIKELRVEKNLKQEELAWQSNIDRTYLNHVETGNCCGWIKNYALRLF